LYSEEEKEETLFELDQDCVYDELFATLTSCAPAVRRLPRSAEVVDKVKRNKGGPHVVNSDDSDSDSDSDSSDSDYDSNPDEQQDYNESEEEENPDDYDDVNMDDNDGDIIREEGDVLDVNGKVVNEYDVEYIDNTHYEDLGFKIPEYLFEKNKKKKKNVDKS
jgi:hypothetical protein